MKDLEGNARFDFGIGLVSCVDCETFPHANRGCQACSARLCRSCFASHSCRKNISENGFAPEDSTRYSPIHVTVHRVSGNELVQLDVDRGTTGAALKCLLAPRLADNHSISKLVTSDARDFGDQDTFDSLHFVVDGAVLHAVIEQRKSVAVKKVENKLRHCKLSRLGDILLKAEMSRATPEDFIRLV